MGRKTTIIVVAAFLAGEGVKWAYAKQLDWLLEKGILTPAWLLDAINAVPHGLLFGIAIGLLLGTVGNKVLTHSEEKQSEKRTAALRFRFDANLALAEVTVRRNIAAFFVGETSANGVVEHSYILVTFDKDVSWASTPNVVIEGEPYGMRIGNFERRQLVVQIAGTIRQRTVNIEVNLQNRQA